MRFSPGRGFSVQLNPSETRPGHWPPLPAWRCGLRSDPLPPSFLCESWPPARISSEITNSRHKPTSQARVPPLHGLRFRPREHTAGLGSGQTSVSPGLCRPPQPCSARVLGLCFPRPSPRSGAPHYAFQLLRRDWALLVSDPALLFTEGGVTVGRSCASVSLSVKSYNRSS